MSIETYSVSLHYCHKDTNKVRVFRTVVEIDSDQPYTDISDIAHERLSELHGDAEVVCEDIS